MKRLATLILLCAASAYGQASVVGTATVKGVATVTSAASAAPSVRAFCSNTAFSTNPSTTCPLTGTPPVASDILVLWVQGDSTQTIVTPTGCGTWAILGSLDVTDNMAFYTAVATGGSCTVTQTATSSSSGG